MHRAALLSAAPWICASDRPTVRVSGCPAEPLADTNHGARRKLDLYEGPGRTHRCPCSARPRPPRPAPSPSPDLHTGLQGAVPYSCRKCPHRTFRVKAKPVAAGTRIKRHSQQDRSASREHTLWWSPCNARPHPHQSAPSWSPCGRCTPSWSPCGR